jgi:hypothetical protein
MSDKPDEVCACGPLCECIPFCDPELFANIDARIDGSQRDRDHFIMVQFQRCLLCLEVRSPFGKNHTYPSWPVLDEAGRQRGMIHRLCYLNLTRKRKKPKPQDLGE